MIDYTDPVYKYYEFSYSGGNQQTITIPANTTPLGMKIVNTLQADNINNISLIAASDGGNITILNHVAIPRGAILVLDQDDLGFSTGQGYTLKFKMSLAAGTIGITIKY